MEESDERFEEMLAKVRPQIHAYLIALVGNAEDAEDLLQSSLVVLWDKREQFEWGTNFIAWARRVALFHARNHMRKVSRSRVRPILDEDLTNAVIERFEEREREFVRHMSALQSCLRKLPDRQRQAIEEKFLGERPTEEIAAELGLTPNALAQLIFRAKENLIRCMKTESLGATPFLRDE